MAKKGEHGLILLLLASLFASLALLLLAFFSASLTPTAAQQFFSLTYTNTTIQKSCPCQPVSYYFYLKNPANLPETYSLKVDSEFARYTSSTIPSKFTLQPTQETNFKLIIKTPCELYGTKKINLVISSEKGHVTYPLTYDILPCYNYEIETGELVNDLEKLNFIKHEGSYNICENESKILPVKITNNAQFLNKFTVNLKGKGKNVMLKINSLSLDSGSSAILPVYLSTQQYDKNQSTIILSFKSDKGNLEKTASLELSSTYCITPEIKISPITVNYTKQEKELIITNLGSRKEIYEIALEAPDWVDFQKTQATLNPQQNQNFTIILDPKENIKSRTYSAGINVKALSTGNTYSKEFSIKLIGKTFSDKLALSLNKISGSLAISLNKLYSAIKVPLSLLLRYILKYIWAIILGLLILAILIFIARQYEEFQKLEAKKPKLKPVVVKKLKPVIKEKRKIAFPLISPYLIFLAIILIIVAAAYYLKPSYQQPELQLAQPYIKPFNITQINISLIQPYNLSVPLEAIAYIKEKSYDNIYIISFLLFILLSAIIIYFIIRKREKEFEKEFEKEIKEELKELKEPELIEEKEKLIISPSKLAFVAIAGIIILLIISLFFFKFPSSITTFITNLSLEEISEYQEPFIANTTKIPALILEQNKQHTVNLTEYFYDADNDRLHFSAITGDNIAVDINEHGIAILKPKKGFYGTSSIIFIADDGKGGIAKTNNITLVVRKSS